MQAITMENGSMKRLITIISISVLLLAFATAELIFVGNIVSNMEKSVNLIAQEYVINKDNISILEEKINKIGG